MAWYRSRCADFGLRVAGLLLCGIAWIALTHLARLHLVPHRADAFACLLAMVGFLSASIGAAAVLLGRHLFDEVEVSARWRHDRRGQIVVESTPDRLV